MLPASVSARLNLSQDSNKNVVDDSHLESLLDGRTDVSHGTKHEAKTVMRKSCVRKQLGYKRKI